MYPNPGNGIKVWQPSWSQIMDKNEVLPSLLEMVTPFWDGSIGIVGWKDNGESDWAEGVCIKSGYVQGLAEGSHDGRDRQGDLIVKGDAGERHTFKINANHQYHIPDGLYTLLGNVQVPFSVIKESEGKYWVVGQRLPDQRFKKLSVFHILDQNEEKRLRKLGFAVKEKTFLA
ncbi:hypothetical protein F5146DRAFT_1002297 [Armillaria mellea]|nr:hypothetical protein F5146DRAFT_1002297 [Armillaria mellea]